MANSNWRKNKVGTSGYRQFVNKATSDAYRAGQAFEETGSFESFRYGPTDEGFVIGTFKVDNGESIICKGTVPGAVLGAPYKLSGKVIEDKTWGIQVNVNHAAMSKPTGTSQLKAFLGSGAIPGIGPVTASRIIKKFGDETLDILENDIDRLIEVPGIGEKAMKKIKEAVPAQLKYRDIIGFFSDLGISMRTINRLLSEYGMATREVIEKNPYILCRVRGFAFSRADNIAQRIGISKTDPNRLYAGIVATLRWVCDNNGHTVYPRDELISLSQEKLQVNDTGILSDTLNQLIKERKLIEDENGIHLRHYFKAEQIIKNALEMSVAPEPLMSEKKVKQLIDKCSKENKMALTGEQEQAIINLFQKKITIMSAGAGCGKTFTCALAVKVAQKAGYTVCLMSPTGRAAKHLSDVCGAPGYTMHRALAIMVREANDEDFFSDNEALSFTSKSMSEAVEHFNNSDIVIADEASMMDTEMAAILFNACKDKHLMLVGDPNQLPSVGAGRVLGDLMESSYSKVHGMLTMLTQIFRQKEGSPVIEAANRIQNGKSPVGVKGVRFYDCKRKEDVPMYIEKHVLPYIKRRQLGYEDYVFLSPIKKTQCSGVNALNTFLRPKLNRHYKEPPEGKEFLFQKGDFVMQTRNNYEVDIYNGDIGIVEEIERDGSVSVQFSGDDEAVVYEHDEVYAEHQIIPAFAMTVHKSQGDQYDTVVLALTSDQFPMLSRNLLYTAVTRAENELILIGDAKAFSVAASNQKEKKRRTGLVGI